MDKAKLLDLVLSALENEPDSYLGFCLACGYEQGGCEPDARDYKCEECGERKVYGAEECLIMLR